jgi:DnaK suppressor protein
MKLTDEELVTFKKKLEQTKLDLEREIQKLGEAPEFGSDVDHFEEEADEAEEYSKNLGIGKALKERLSNVERALEKMKVGSYGVCENCQNPIEVKILAIDPESKFCKACKK